MNRYADYNKDFPLRPLGRDDDGHKRYGCRRCGKMVPKRCRSFCSDECRIDVLVRCGTDVRHFVGERDHGWCARCGLIVPDLVRRILRAEAILKGDYFKAEAYQGEHHLRPSLYWHSSIYHPRFGTQRKTTLWLRFLGRIGIEPNDLDGKSLWEAHHKIAVKDGGGACGLDGLETLCRWCHKKESAAQQAQWAKERRMEKTGQRELF